DRIHRSCDGRPVDSGNGDRRPRPETRADAARSLEREVALDLGELAKLVLVHAAPCPLLTQQAGHRDVAVLVVKGCQRMQKRDLCVRRRAAVLTTVLAAREWGRPNADVGQAA